MLLRKGSGLFDNHFERLRNERVTDLLRARKRARVSAQIREIRTNLLRQRHLTFPCAAERARFVLDHSRPYIYSQSPEAARDEIGNERRRQCRGTIRM